MREHSIAELVHYRSPVTLSSDATVQEACRVIRDQKVGCVLVTDSQNRLLGIFTVAMRSAGWAPNAWTLP